MTTSPSKLTQLREKAGRQFKCGEVANALDLYHSVLKIKPDDAVALNGAGAAHVQLGNLECATDFFERALEAAPQYEVAFFNLLKHLLSTEHVPRAQGIFDEYAPNIKEGRQKRSLRETLFDRPITLNPPFPPPIAIGGCGSSGTTLLRRILDAHPEIACGKEMSVFDRPITYDLSIDELRARFEAQRFDGFDRGVPYRIVWPDGTTYFGLKRGNHGDYYHTPEEVLALFNRAEAGPEFWHLYFYSYAQKQGKARWAEKTPNNVFFADRFLDFFPRGRFINMIRDGRDVCLSLVNRRDFSPESAAERWRLSIQAGQRVAHRNRVYTLRYEDLVTQPEATIRDLMAWLDIPFAPSMLHFAEKTAEENRWGYAEQSVFSDAVYRWRTEWKKLPDGVGDALLASLKPLLESMNYPME
jgi:tetratricopeptide (TPR) repeat protein